MNDLSRAENGTPREVLVYTPPVRWALGGTIVNGVCSLGFGIWSWFRGDNRKTSIFAALFFAAGAGISYATFRALTPRRVRLHSLHDAKGFVSTEELRSQQTEIVEILEDVAEQISGQNTPSRQFIHTKVQEAWEKVIRASNSGLSTRNLGLLLKGAHEHIQRKNEILKRELNIEINPRDLGPQLLPVRNDLGNNATTWNELDRSLRENIYLQGVKKETQVRGRIKDAYSSLNRALIPLANLLGVDLKSRVAGAPTRLYFDENLNQSHHAITCGLNALLSKAKTHLESKAREVRETGEKLTETKTQFERAQKEATSLKKRLEEAHKEISQKEKSVVSLTKKAASAENMSKELAQLKAQLEEKQKEATSLKKKLEKAHRLAKSEKEEKLRIIKEKHQQTQRAEAEAKAFAQEQKKRVKEKGKEIVALTERAQTAEEGLEEVTGSLKEVEKKVKRIAKYYTKGAILPKEFELPDEQDPFFEIFFTINELIRSIKRHYLNQSSEDLTPSSTPTSTPQKLRPSSSRRLFSSDDETDTGSLNSSDDEGENAVEF